MTKEQGTSTVCLLCLITLFQKKSSVLSALGEKPNPHLLLEEDYGKFLANLDISMHKSYFEHIELKLWNG